MTNIEKFLKHHGFRLNVSHEQAKRVDPDIGGIYEKGHLSVGLYPRLKLWILDSLDITDNGFDSIKEFHEFRRLFYSFDTALRQIEDPWGEAK